MTVAARPRGQRDPLVGRVAELDALEHGLDDLNRSHAAAIALVGEPGIGKTRLLSELSARAEVRGHLVLCGSASELERLLPFSVFVHALDEYVESLDPCRLSTLDDDVQAELAHVLPSLTALGSGRAVALQEERYRSHRAMRALLELLAQPGPLVLILDDFHWADPASVELLGALLRRPPAAAVLIAIAFRPHQTPDGLATAVEHAHRTGALTCIELGALTPVEARELLGQAVDPAEAATLFDESGGNPLYLQQLARMFDRAGATILVSDISLTEIGIPPAVAAALSEELGLLSADTRGVLEGAAVAGDPFELDLAAAAAPVEEAAALGAIDELLRLDLIRSTDVPRRFRFRHPLVRRAVYEASPGGWRLGAHERCAEALEERGAPAAVRAHHVERSARQGDAAAVAVLRDAGEQAARLAPESAGRWLGAALRLLPETAPVEERVELLSDRARAQAASGHFIDSHATLLEAVALVHDCSSVMSTALATACAGVERQLGRYEQAHDRLVTALERLPERATAESADLLIELTLNEFYRSRYEAMHGWAEHAVRVAGRLDDAALLATAAVMPAFSSAMTGPTDEARASRAEAAALVDALSDEELSRRPDAAAWLAAVEIYLDLYAEADAHGTRALELARATGGGDPLFRLYPILPRIWYVRGKLADAADLLDGAIEAGRLLGSPPALAGNLFNRSAVATAVGDLELALANAEEGVELARGLDAGFVTAWAAVRLAAVLLETGDPVRAAALLVDRTGGEESTLIPGGWRAYSLELLTRCRLALDCRSEAERAAASAEVAAAASGLPLPRAWADRAAAAVALHSGETARAVELALASAAAAGDVGAPIESGLSRTLAGRALGREGQSERAVHELQLAAAAFEACGAFRYRGLAERELGILGHRPHRRTRAGKPDGTVIERLTEREIQVTRLVVDRKTNPEIAAELFLSQKTVETHLRNIFRKVGVTTRVELARAVLASSQE